MSEHPIHGPVTISVTDDTRKLGEALEEIARMKAALRGVLDLIDKGVLVRDTSRDHEPEWAMRMVPLLMAIQSAKVSLEAQ